MRLDVVGDAGGDNSALGQTHGAQWFFAQLIARHTMPSRFVVQLTHLGRVLINRPTMSAFGQSGHCPRHGLGAAFDPDRTWGPRSDLFLFSLQ